MKTKKNSTKPFFLITIDAEGDNLWSRPKIIETKNAEFLHRFQILCEKYGLKPTYLTNYEMAISPNYVEFGREVIKKQTGEIGMHLHAWNNPPLESITNDDLYYQPYLIEYNIDVMYKKIIAITNLLKETFNNDIISHRSGRWAFNQTYANLLIDNGYKIDCSVTPLRSWSSTKGHPAGEGGSDYRFHPQMPYLINSTNSKTNKTLLEIPVTIISRNNWLNNFISISDHFSIINKKLFQNYLDPIWLRPNGKNIDLLKKILKYKLKVNHDYVMFTLHSSELMPGGSPTFRNENDIEKLYSDIEEVFSLAKKYFLPATLKEYHHYYLK